MTESGHTRAAIALLAMFVASGLVLEAVIGLRVAGLLDDPLRRSFVRLGHAHGGLLALCNLAAGWAMHVLATPDVWARRIRGAMLLSAPTVAGGFVGGGLWHGPVDPGPIVLAVPAGALLALAGLTAIALVRSQRGSSS